MTYFTWKEEGLTKDCETLDSMAARFEESARLMRKMSAEGFKVEKRNKRQIITHIDSKVFNDWGFVSEEPPYQQLTMILEEKIQRIVNYNLPEKCREIFILSRVNGLPNQDIAELLNISRRTVENQLYRALKILRSKLSNYL